MNFWQMVLYGFAGLLVAAILFWAVVLGAAAGAFWYFSRSPGFQYTAEYPIQDPSGKQQTVVVKAVNTTSIPPEVVEQMVREGVVQANVQVQGGPFDTTLANLSFFVRVPFEDIIRKSMVVAGEEILGKEGKKGLLSQASSQVKQEIGPVGSAFLEGDISKAIARSLGGSDQLATALLGAGGTMSVGELRDSKSPLELRALLGDNYTALLDQLSKGNTQTTVQQRLKEDPQGTWKALTQNVPPSTLEGLLRQTLGDAAGKDLKNLLGSTSPEELEAVFGRNYQSVLQNLLGSQGTKTLGQAFLENPFPIMDAISQGRRESLLKSLLGGQ